MPTSSSCSTGPAAGEDRPSVELELGGFKPRRLLAHVSPLPDRPGDLLVVLVDVTNLRRLESIRKDFVANASHELRTPVASIRSAAETLRTALDDPGAALGFVEILERNAERLQRLVEDLLDLSRIESREFALRTENVDLSEFLERILPLYQDRFQQKRMPLLNTLPEGTAPPGRSAGPGDDLLQPPRQRGEVLPGGNPGEHRGRSDRTAGFASRVGGPGTRASRPSTCPGSSSASTGWMRAVRGTWAEPAWASPSSSISQKPWRAPWGWKARPGRAPASR